MTTINDVAKLAGVSKSTVSHVFNDTKFTSDDVKERVLQAAKELNYKSNYYAKTLATNKSQVIGIQLDSPTGSMNMFQQKVTNGILKVCSEAEYYLLMMPKRHIEKEYFPIDGMILMNPTLNDEDQIDFPHIWLGRPSEALVDSAYYVDNDNRDMLKKLTEFLMANTEKGILYMNAPADTTVAEDRQAGYFEALKDKPNIQVHHTNYNREVSPAAFAYDELTKLWETNQIDSIIVDNDFMAQGVYKFAMEKELTIPRDLSVVAVSEGLESSEFFSPSLSYVDLDEVTLGEKIASNLIQLINNQPTKQQELVNSKINIKESIRG